MNDGKFDEPEPEFQPEGRADDDSLAPSSAPGLPLSPPALYSPLSQPKSPVTPPRAPSRPGIPPHLNTPPAQIPEQAPLLLVPYHVHLGFRNIPFSIRDFFYERRKVREGAEAAYRLIMSQTRDFRGPNEQPSDLDFDTKAENSFRPSYSNLPAEIASSRKKYYTEELPPKLKLARELASNEREPTKDETKYPPPTEVELRAERLKKEMKWRDDEEAWEVLRKGKPVVWDERFKDSLKVFEDADVGSGWSGQ
jgi:import inner membrane translocase subunit TIM54